MSEFERRKDQVQEGVTSGAALVGRIAVIITDAVGAIAREVGDFVTDGIEMAEAARTARQDERSVTGGQGEPRGDDDPATPSPVYREFPGGGDPGDDRPVDQGS